VDKNATYVIEASRIHERDEENPRSRQGNNGNWWFAPASRMLRGKWHFGLVADKGLGDFMTGLSRICREIPGECVFIDLVKGEWGTFDPMNETEDGKRKAARIVAYYKANPMMGSEPQFRRRHTMPATSPDVIKNVLYWMRRGVDAKYAVVTPGSPKLPSMAEIIALPGRRVVSPGSAVADKETKEHLEQFSHAVPVGNRGQVART
jgi:hypothetical protein